jgi:NAD-dependent deacetylase
MKQGNRAVDSRNIVILTGAGISAESGLATFRGSDGLWCGHPIEEVATPEAYARNPALVQEFYNQRRRQLREVVPNAAHHALARLAAEWQGNFLLVTQNVDDLHDRALGATPPRPSFRLIHMHGELTKARCTRTQQVKECYEDLPAEGRFRPHIVWFGEMPLEMTTITRALAQTDIFVAIGTSGNVYPAAGFVAEALAAGAHTVEINLEPSLATNLFAQHRHGRASELVPAFVAELLQG